MRIYLLIFGFLLSLSTYGNEIFTNELCGGSSKNNRPCHYVKNINFHLDNSLYGKESFSVVSKYLTERVDEMNKEFSHLGVKVNFKPFPGNSWRYRKKEKKSHVEIMFLFTETTDKKFMLITFYTFSKFTYYINTSQCPSSNNDCMIGKMRGFIDEIVIKSVTQDGN
jgi:hypothetical protein